MTIKVHSMKNNNMVTVTLTDEDVKWYEEYYKQMSENFRKKVTTIEDFIAFILSANV